MTYADGTQGHQGHNSEDAEPWRRSKQPRILKMVADADTYGITALEVEERTGLGHGVVSGCLSSMHMDGLVCRLADTRRRYGVYVLPENVVGREVREHRSNL